MHILSLQLPLVEPVMIIALMLLIILIGPVLFERIRIPAIVGLLLSGALIGENGFNLVTNELEFTLLSTMGLLYLMFLAGLEIDLIDFLENKIKSIFIGIASYLIPFIFGFLVSRYILDYSPHASWLIGAMLSSHTLVTYPMMGKLGILNKSVVTIIVGATIIADILALISMELIINFSGEGVGMESMLMLLLNFSLFFALVFLIIPRLAKFFLNAYEGQLSVQYIFVLAVLFVTAVVAHLLEIEPILGAFFSGLVMNRFIMHDSPLYKRVEFIGNALFIPFFLISIGMLANFRVYIDDPRQIGFLLVLIATAIATKYIAAYISRIIFRISKVEMNLVFGMSVSRAASAVAIILIGLNMGIVSEAILNNTVILILATSILSSYVTQSSGKKLLLEGNDTITEHEDVEQKILVPVANPETMTHLLEFASLIKQGNEKEPIHPLSVFTDKNNIKDKIKKSKEQLGKVITGLQVDAKFDVATRIDKNVARGIIRAAEEFMSTVIILGWHKKETPFQALFGDLLDQILKKTGRMLVVLKTPSDFRNVEAIRLFTHENSQFEEGFTLWMDTLIPLFRKLQVKVYVYSDSVNTTNAILKYAEKNNALKYFEVEKHFEGRIKEMESRDFPSDLLIFVHSRKNSVWHSRKFSTYLNSSMEKHDDNNVIILYPEES